jgi:hypothetical protein
MKIKFYSNNYKQHYIIIRLDRIKKIRNKIHRRNKIFFDYVDI